MHARSFANIRSFLHTEREVIERSVLIKNMLDDLGDSGEAIPISNVSIPKRSTSFSLHHFYPVCPRSQLTFVTIGQ